VLAETTLGELARSILFSLLSAARGPDSDSVVFSSSSRHGTAFALVQVTFVSPSFSFRSG
jgi:hypothetical protein